MLYICGLLGMQDGVYQVLARHGLTGGYLTIKDEFQGVDPGEWTSREIKRQIRPTGRCMVEVY